MALSLHNRKVYNPMESNSPEILGYLQKKGIFTVSPAAPSKTHQRSKNSSFNSPKGMPGKAFVFAGRYGPSEGESPLKNYNLNIQEKEKSYPLLRKGSGGVDLKQGSYYQNQNTIESYRNQLKQRTEEKRQPFDKFRTSEPDIRMTYAQSDADSLGLRLYESSNLAENSAYSSKLRKKLEITVDTATATTTGTQRTVKQARPSSTKNAEEKKSKVTELFGKTIGQSNHYSFDFSPKLGGNFKSVLDKTQQSGTKEPLETPKKPFFTGNEKPEPNSATQIESNRANRYSLQPNETKYSPKTKFIRPEISVKDSTDLSTPSKDSPYKIATNNYFSNTGSKVEESNNRSSGNQTPTQHEKLKPIYSTYDSKAGASNGKTESALDAFVTRVKPGDLLNSPSMKTSPRQQFNAQESSSLKKPDQMSEHSKIPSSQSISLEYQSQEQPKIPLESKNIKASKYVFSSQKKDEITNIDDSNALVIPTSFINSTYYMTSFQKYLRSPNDKDYFNQIYKEHFNQSFQALKFIKYSKPVDSRMLKAKKVFLNRRPGYQDKKTIIFDLDETLIHCNENLSIPYDVKLPIKFPHGDVIEAGINIRPYAVECLKELSQHFEIIVFTASHSCYANVVLNYLDPQGQYVHHRLFRDSCIQTEEGVHVKDLRILANRDLNDVVLVDNAAYSFGFQIENGIPIIPFYHNKEDQELLSLIPYLKQFTNAKDLREINKQTFKFHLYTQLGNPEKLLEKLLNP